MKFLNGTTEDKTTEGAEYGVQAVEWYIDAVSPVHLDSTSRTGAIMKFQGGKGVV